MDRLQKTPLPPGMARTGQAGFQPLLLPLPHSHQAGCFFAVHNLHNCTWFENLHKQNLTASETNSEARSEYINANGKEGEQYGQTEVSQRLQKNTLDQLIVDIS